MEYSSDYLGSCCCGPAQAGLDSLGAVELRNAVSKAFGIPVPASLAFDYPTQAALASYISGELAARAGITHASQAITMPDQRQESTSTDIVSVACLYPAAEATGKPSFLQLPPFQIVPLFELSSTEIIYQGACCLSQSEDVLCMLSE